ncbi:MAG: carbamoyltransferase HypF, partial [Actinomycetota bacterium]|nr:carbamoyltransferase HypF [Actinomycetota bacterium]
MRNIKRLRIEVSGIVQGVGFRPHVHRLAARWRLAGWARNSGGALELEVQGAAESCVSFLEDLVKQAPAPAHVHRLGVTEIRADGQEEAFTIIDSRMASKQSRFIPVDIGICDACRRELLDGRDRRHHYPFTNCCACGPRYTIIERLPYDRERTSMRSFHLCLDCDFEYANEVDRRFHAEPNACPECGPQYTYVDRHGSMTGKAAVAAAAKSLVEGKVIGVKGIGGIHLTCLATDPRPVDKIRRLKDRPAKPLAVMVSDEKEAARLGRLSEAEADLLRGPERPIVLLGRRAGALADNVCPGVDTVGVLLPYAPIHVLLLNEARAPLVMTSANRGGAPIIIDNEAAATKIKGNADGLLLHDRRIVNGCDDSVVRHRSGRSITMRLGRGKAPAALRLPGDYRPILACGSDLKSTICVAAGGWAHVSQYLGDLSDPDCLGRFRETVDRLGRLLNIVPELVACDAHPDYAGTRWARRWNRRSGLPLTQVWHHHAHASGVAGEFPAIKNWLVFTWDGVGLGEDGTLWGGEALLGG